MKKNKRIYWESVKKWAISVGLGSVPLVIVLFIYLSYANIITIHDYNWSRVCGGTVDDPCWATVTFTANSDFYLYPLGYDPYGRNTPFNFSKAVKDWKLYRKWGDGWREIDLNEGCTGRWCGCYWCKGGKTAKYSYAFRSGKNYTIKIVAYKKDAFEDVKWSFGFPKDNRTYIDPVWRRAGEYRLTEIAGRKYTPQCLSDCHLPIELKFYKDYKFDKLDMLIRKGSSEFADWGIDYLVIENYTVTISNCTYKCRNITFANGTIGQDCKAICNPYNTAKQRYIWKPLKTLNVKANKPIIIDLWGRRKAKLGNIVVDVVPKLADFELAKLSWWNSSWERKRPINLSVSSGSTPKGYQVKLNITYDSDMQTDFDDLRFVNGSENTELPYWVEEKSNGEWAVVWVKVDQNITTDNYTIYMYYGNPSATSESNGSAVFEFFDDFSGDLSQWEQVGAGTASIVEDADAYNGDACKISPGTGERTLWISTTFDGNYAVETRMKGNKYFRVFMRGQDKTALREAIADFHSTNDITNMIYDYIDGVSIAIGGTGDKDWTVYHRESMRAQGLNYYWYLDGELYISGTDSGASQPTSGYIGINSQQNDAFFDFVAIRKYTSPEPSYSIGGEESIAPIIIINSPQNTTYIDIGATISIPINFTVYGNISTYQVKVYANGSEIYSNDNYANNTNTQIERDWYEGNQNVTIWANSSEGVESTKTVLFTTRLCSASSDWLNNSFAKRKGICILEQSSNNLTNYSIAINISYDSDMQTDFDDLRFSWYNESFGSEIETRYWVEEKSDGEWAVVWIKIPSIPADSLQTIYMYYGNPNATSESNGSAVFDFFDDFEDGDYSDKWTLITGTASETNGYLEVSSTSSIEGLIEENVTQFSDTNGFVVEGKIMQVTTNDLGEILFHGDLTKDNYYIFVVGYNDKLIIDKQVGGSGTSLAQVSQVINENVWYDFRVTRKPDGTIIGEIIGVNSVSATDTSLTSGYVGVRVGGKFSDTCRVDNYRVRKYAEPEPTYSIGEEETSLSTCSNITSSGIYYLTVNIINSSTSYCMNISANDVTLDCQGNTIDGIDNSDTYGVYASRSGWQVANITIKNCIITDWDEGIHLAYTSEVDILNNTISSTISYGIYLYYTGYEGPGNIKISDNVISDTGNDGMNLYPYFTYSNITNNTILSAGQDGITIFTGGDYNIIENNTIENAVANGICFGGSDNNTVRNNIIRGCNYSIRLVNNPQDNFIYNNLFNNSGDISYVAIYGNNWNTTYQSGTNIWNDSLGYIWGNAWFKPDGTGFSEVECNDINPVDGFCDSPYELAPDNIDYHPIAKEYGMVADIDPPTFSNWQQDPLDINSSTIGKLYVNVTITDESGVNASSVRFYHWINDSQYPNQPWKFINGTAQEFVHEHTMTNITDVFNITLHTYAYNPSVFNVDPETMASATKYNYSLDSNNKALKVRFYNISTHPNTTYILKARLHKITGDLIVYYCNSSYTNGKIYNSDYCVPLTTLISQDETHYYQNIYFYGDENSYLDAVQISETGFIVFYPVIGSDWEVEYANIDSNSVETTTSGGTSWTNQDFTPDVWLIQINGNGLTTFSYKVYACDMLENCGNSSVQEDSYAIANLPPSPAPKIIIPGNDTYSGVFNITWEPSKDPNSDPFNYSLYLYYANGTLADVLADNNIPEGTEYYTFDSTNYPSGQYYLIANATDDAGNTNFYILPYYFTIGAPDMNITFGPPQTSIFRWAVNDSGYGCGPDYTSYWVEPRNQTDVYGIFWICNNGTISGGVQAKLSGTPNTGWSIMFTKDNSSAIADAIAMTTNYQTIYSNLGVNECIYTWGYANCTQVSANPGVNIEFDII